MTTGGGPGPGGPPSWRTLKESRGARLGVLKNKHKSTSTVLVAARAVDAHLLNFESHPGRGIGCDRLGQREVDNRALLDLVPPIFRHAALPEGARHIELFA